MIAEQKLADRFDRYLVVTSGQIIHAVAQDIEGRIWVGKLYDGIDVLSKETGKVKPLVAHDDNGRSLPHNTIYDL